jgi:flagellar basal-body rod modification protein FlgD
MSVNSISNIASNTAGTAAASTSSSPTQSLSQADFLKLLVAQMTSQDPLNPTDSQNILTQTVQLSTLQSNTTLQSTLAQLNSNQSLSQASSMLGRQVTLQVDNTTTAQGVVSSIDVSSGTPMIVVNGTEYSLDQVISISTPSATQ